MYAPLLLVPVNSCAPPAIDIPQEFQSVEWVREAGGVRLCVRYECVVIK